MNKLDVPGLQAFVSAVEERSLTRAAARERLVVSAISRRILELERRVGHALLTRHGRGVVPTPAGRQLYPHARRILDDVRHAAHALADHDGDAACLRVAAPSCALAQLAPGSLRAGTPGLRIDIVARPSDTVLRLLAEDKADVGIYHASQPAPGMTSWICWTDRLGLAVPPGHPLASRAAVYLDEALDFDLLGYFPRQATPPAFPDAHPRLPARRQHVAGIEARCGLVLAGLGIALVAERAGRRHAERHGLRWLPLRDAEAARQTYVGIDARRPPRHAGAALARRLATGGLAGAAGPRHADAARLA